MFRLATIRPALIGGAAAAGLLVGAPAAMAQVQSPCGPTTTVQPGDTFFAISQRCEAPLAQVQAANPRINPRSLQVGQTLRLHAAAQPAFPQPTRPAEDVAGFAAALGGAIRAMEENGDAGDFLQEFGRQFLAPEPMPEPEAPVERIQVTGVLTEEGVECPTMRGADGALYSLSGDLEGFQSGDVVRVEGYLPDFSFCQRGATVEVDRIAGH